jgi:hypothetical protein
MALAVAASTAGATVTHLPVPHRHPHAAESRSPHAAEQRHPHDATKHAKPQKPPKHATALHQKPHKVSKH